jgi:hypothetical protein
MLLMVGTPLLVEYKLSSLLGASKLGVLVRLKASAWKRIVTVSRIY